MWERRLVEEFAPISGTKTYYFETKHNNRVNEVQTIEFELDSRWFEIIRIIREMMENYRDYPGFDQKIIGVKYRKPG